MPIEVMSAEAATELLKENRFSSWPRRTAEDNRVAPFAKPDFTPSFELVPGEKVFTIGSCFARNVENALLARGFRLPARDVLKQDADFHAIGPNILNNYGVASIYNELKWALDEQLAPTSQCLYEISPKKFVDIHLNHALRPAPLEIVSARRNAILAAYRQIRTCRVVILTLGLTECFFDTENKVYINTAPRRQMVKACPGRFEFHVLDYTQVISFLQKSVTLLRDHGPSDLRVVLTVSPVPLAATHRKMDVITANMYSKSVLRAAAEEIVTSHEFVDYFPSFESILTSERHLTWEEDQIHIKKEAIDLNISRMVSRYVNSSQLESESIESVISRLSEMSAGTVFLELEHHTRRDHEPKLQFIFADAAIKLRKFGDAFACLEGFPAGLMVEEVAWMKMQIAAGQSDYASALIWEKDVSEVVKRRAGYWIIMIKVHAALKDADECKLAVSGWAKLVPHSAEPYRLGGVYLGQLQAYPDADYMFRKAMAIAGDSDPAVALDYAEYLANRGRVMLARQAVKSYRAENPQQQSRLEELLLRIGPGRVQRVSAVISA